MRFAGNQGRSTLVMRTRWAIHDKTKFEGLIHHLKDLVDGLNQVVLVKRETQDQIMHDRRNIEEWLRDAKGISEDDEVDAAAISKRKEKLSRSAESSTQGRPQRFLTNSANTVPALLFDSIPSLHYSGSICFVLTE